MKIRKYRESDWKQVWPVMEQVFRTGETYPVSPEISERDAYKYWIDLPNETYIAAGEDDAILGTYYIKPNQPGLGAHVCNCGYIVSENARNQGVGSDMCRHSQQVAIDMGFKAMQYNLVVSTNAEAVRVWKKHGFRIIGVLPKAFHSRSAGYVDALVMYKQLTAQ